MIIGIATLFMLLFGGGNLEVFYLDKLEQGVNKYIVDKDRKKDLQGDLKAYTSTVKEFNKVRSTHLKELKKKNLDRATSGEWYVEFFEMRMQERVELEKKFITQRIGLQQKINDDEWANIMKMASDETTKLAEKEQKKEMKKRDKNIFRNQETAIVENVADQDRRVTLLAALSVYEALYDQLHESYENINVNESTFLADKNASKEKMLYLAELLSEQRALLYEGYMVFLIALHGNTTEEEWKPIMVSFNKLIE